MKGLFRCAYGKILYVKPRFIGPALEVGTLQAGSVVMSLQELFDGPHERFVRVLTHLGVGWVLAEGLQPLREK